MPAVADILRIESQCFANEVILFAEGLFYRAYQRSAWKLAQKFGLKPTKKYVKCVDEYVVSVGFPRASLLKYLPEVIVDNGVCKSVWSYSIGDDYEEWLFNLPCKEQQIDLQKNINVVDRNIAKRILTFDLLNASPLDCQRFILNLQKDLSNG